MIQTIQKYNCEIEFKLVELYLDFTALTQCFFLQCL